MREEAFYFGEEGGRLFGTLHHPDGDGKGEGFVMVGPFAEEKLWTQRVFVTFARELAGRGYTVLRFDFKGHGDSEGEFEESDVRSRLDDISRAVDTLAEKMGGEKSVGLVGLRFGATLAALAAEEAVTVDRLVLWEPITSGRRYMQDVLRSNLATQTAVYKEIRWNREDLVRRMEQGETVNYDGYEISHALYSQACDIDLIKRNKPFRGSCLIVQISRGPAKVRKDLEALGAVYPGSRIEVAEEESFWRDVKLFYTRAEDLFEKTVSWLEQADG